MTLVMAGYAIARCGPGYIVIQSDTGVPSSNKQEQLGRLQLSEMTGQVLVIAMQGLTEDLLALRLRHDE